MPLKLLTGLNVVGTAFPGSPATNDQFYRSDFRAWFQYDGSAWRQTSVGDFSGSFPGSPTTNLRVFRVDLGWECFYDGTRWLTTTEYSLFVCQQTGNSANFDTTFVVVRDDYRAYFTRVAVHSIVATTNNGSNYWTIICQGVDTAISATTTIASRTTTIDGTAGAYATLTPSAALPTNRPLIRASCTKTGTPGGLSVTMTAYHRLVIP